MIQACFIVQRKTRESGFFVMDTRMQPLLFCFSFKERHHFWLLGQLFCFRNKLFYSYNYISASVRRSFAGVLFERHSPRIPRFIERVAVKFFEECLRS